MPNSVTVFVKLVYEHSTLLSQIIHGLITAQNQRLLTNLPPKLNNFSNHAQPSLLHTHLRMQPWPGTRGRPNFGGRIQYQGPIGQNFPGRIAMLERQTFGRAARSSINDRAFGYAGGWGGPYGDAWYGQAAGRFGDLQPGYVRWGGSQLGNAPFSGGFI